LIILKYNFDFEIIDLARSLDDVQY